MEILEKYKQLKTTYGELEAVLKKLNYKKKRKDNTIAFVNKEHNSIIRLIKKRKKDIAVDKDDKTVFLAESAWMLQMAQEAHPEVQFHASSEF